MSFEASNLFNCKDLVIVITGGGSGLGSYAAKALDANGAKAVYIIGRRKESLDKVASECPNGSVKAIVGDVTDKDSLTAAAAQVQKEVGYVNVLFANSGVGGTARAPRLSKDYSVKEFKDVMWDAPMSEFTNTFNVNVTGAFYTALAFLELLDAGNKQRNIEHKSQILLTASVAGLSRYLAFGFDYSGSKAALIHMTKMMATNFARFKIRANTIAPGFYPSEMTSDMPAFKGDKDPTKEGGVPAESSPLERFGSPQDFAGAVLFLLSPAGSFINGRSPQRFGKTVANCGPGNVLVTDGGRISTIPAVY